MSPGPYETNENVWVRKEDSPENSQFLTANGEDPTNSQSQLLPKDALNRINGNETNSDTVDGNSEPPGIANIPKWRRYAAVAILFFINLLNYMDRFTIAAVLTGIRGNFEISNAMAGLLQTVFIISYMLVAPLFGYLGDRYNRKIIMAFGITIWSGVTLASSFIEKPEHFPLFLLTRALVGIGEASYATISPTLIGDMFVGPKRTQMLSVFFFATPIGSGLGFIVGSAVASALGGWEWALRVTPGLGLIAIILLLLFCPNPPRGACETTVSVGNAKNRYREDLWYLVKNKSFIYVTLGFTFQAFVIGSLTLWGPTYFASSQVAIGELDPCTDDNCAYTQINFVFGLITCIAGFVGVGVGAEWARRWKLAGRKDADAIVCAVGLFCACPCLLLGVQVAVFSLKASWVMIFFAEVFMCLTWTLISDMTLYVTEPSRRSTANAVQLLVGHLFGDAGSPYLLGLIADALIRSSTDTYWNVYLSYQRAMYVTLIVCVFGGGGFLMTSLYVANDKKKVDDFLKGSDSSTSSGTSSTTVEMETKKRNGANVPVVTINGSAGHDGQGSSHDSLNSDQIASLLGPDSTV